MRTPFSCRVSVPACFLAMAGAAALTGCAGLGRVPMQLFDAALVRTEERSDLARIRSDTRDVLAEQRADERRLDADREVEQARLDAERAQMERDFCRANQEAERLRLQSNIQENLQSKVAFNVMQGLEVGELEVDVEQLKELIQKREQEPVRETPPVKRPCTCCEQVCGCRPGLVRRLCPRCRHKPCEETCGGPEALRELEQLPFKQPLRPAEIPLKLPVRLTFGMQNPAIEETRVIRLPVTEEGPPCRGCGRCHRGGCADGMSCTQQAAHDEVDADEIDADEVTAEEPLAPPTPPKPRREPTGNTITLK